jgi:opacity protein-like surface antigen/TolB-like protein
MKNIRNRILAASSVLSLAVCLLAFGQGVESKPTCAVMSFEGAGAEDAGLAVLAGSKFAGLIAKSDAYNVIPRLTVNQNLLAQNYDRASYKSTDAAGRAAGKMLKMDYVIIGNVKHTADGYTLKVSLVNIKNGKVEKNATTKQKSSMNEFANNAPQEAVELLLGTIKPKQEAPAPIVVAPVAKPVAKPAIVEKPAVVEPVKAVAVRPVAVTPPEPVPAQVVVPEPIIDLGEEQPMQSKSEPPVIAGSSYPGKDWLSNHLQIGTRITRFNLMKTRKSGENGDASGNFLGSIQELEAIEDYWPTKLYADVYPIRYLGIELTWDDARARTGAWSLPEYPYHSDGDFVISGPIVSLIGRYPNSTKFTPYAGAGIAFLHGKFLSSAWWHGGYHSVGDWQAAGEPDESALPVARNIDVDNVHGTVYFAGCDYAVTDNLLAGIYVRYMEVSLDAHYSETILGTVYPLGDYSIPMDNIAYGLGISYAF